MTDGTVDKKVLIKIFRQKKVDLLKLKIFI